MDRLKSTQLQHGFLPQAVMPKRKLVPRYNVVLINDDYTPMEFVVEVLQEFFYKDHATAVQLMMEVHTMGRAVCGTFTLEIAETKACLVQDYAKRHQHPLMCKIEQAS
jgi:ATP-dependent Clp protease adaptor protein ClpS